MKQLIININSDYIKYTNYTYTFIFNKLISWGVFLFVFLCSIAPSQIQGPCLYPELRLVFVWNFSRSPCACVEFPLGSPVSSMQVVALNLGMNECVNVYTVPWNGLASHTECIPNNFCILSI